MEFKKEDKVISTFLESLGPWKSQIVIGGGYAPIIYKMYLVSDEEGNPPVATRDIDSLIPRKVPEISRTNISNHLENAGFELRYKDRENPPTESYIKLIDEEEVEVEFLTDNSARFNKEKNVSVAGVTAQPLSYLAFSLSDSLPFKTYSGINGFVVSPRAWIFHKGLTFSKRVNKSKAFKDLYGIWYVSTQLGSFSENALRQVADLSSIHPAWYKTFKKSLKSWMEKATPLDWKTLESQDPFGNLNRINFQKVIERYVR